MNIKKFFQNIKKKHLLESFPEKYLFAAFLNQKEDLKMEKTFTQEKLEFDAKYSNQKEFTAFIPVNQKQSESYCIKNTKGEKNEEYYKWQVFSTLFWFISYLGCEVYWK